MRLQDMQNPYNCTLKSMGTESNRSSIEVEKLARGDAKFKPPRIDQLNFDDDLPAPLITLAEEEGIALVSHSDELGKL